MSQTVAENETTVSQNETINKTSPRRSIDDALDFEDNFSNQQDPSFSKQEDVDFADDTDFEYMFSSTTVPFVGSFVENFMYNEILA